MKFLERRVPMGEGDEFLVFEMALPPVPEGEGGTWVVLREARHHKDRTPVLTACFEYISNYLWLELFCVRKLPQPARFFHCRYELKAGGQVGWSLREVKLARDPLDVGLRMASWTYVDESTLASISESLNLSESPERLT